MAVCRTSMSLHSAPTVLSGACWGGGLSGIPVVADQQLLRAHLAIQDLLPCPASNAVPLKPADALYEA
jgi:hypothetical protein